MTGQEAQVKRDAQLVGREVSINPQKPDGLTVHCVVKDVRRSYSHLELLVEPIQGAGQTWVRRYAEFVDEEVGE